jgi:hypothetical protein
MSDLGPRELEAIIEGTADGEPMPVPGTATATDADGFAFDVETGEVLGHAEVVAAFVIDNDHAADWALRLRSQIEGDLAGIEARKRALVRQLDVLHRAKQRRLAWWDWRFGAGLALFARGLLAGKARTAHFTWGSVSFRRTAGRRQILDMDAAVAYVEAWAPGKVKVERTVAIKDLLAAMRAEALATGEPVERPGFLAESGPEESVRISCGIGIAGGEVEAKVEAINEGEGDETDE